jgi:hypothetical protein
VAGAPNGKYVFTTRPLSALTFGGQLEYYYSLFKAPKSASPGGILGVSFEDLYAARSGRPNERLLDDGQRAGAALWYALWGIWRALDDSIPVGANGAKQVPDFESVTGVDRTRAVDVMDRLFFNHLSNPSRRQAVQRALPVAAFDTGKLRSIKIPEAKDVYMQIDALDLLFSAIGDAMHEQNRWVIGRALHTSHPGKSLDIEIGSFTRPYTH